MTNNYTKEVILSLAIIVLAVLLVNPLMLWMPSSLAMGVVLVFALACLIFGTFVWRESAADERDHLHKSSAGRLAFLVGSGVLALGIIVQSFSHTIDPWLVVALTLMVLGKVVGLIYSDRVN